MRDAFHEPARHLAESAHTFTRFRDHRRRDTRDPRTGCRHRFLGDCLALGCSLPLRRFARRLGAFRRNALCRAPLLRCALRRRALPRLFLSRSAARLGPLGRRTGRLALRCHGCSSREVRESRSPQKIRAKRPRGKSRGMRQVRLTATHTSERYIRPSSDGRHSVHFRGLASTGRVCHKYASADPVPDPAAAHSDQAVAATQSLRRPP